MRDVNTVCSVFVDFPKMKNFHDLNISSKFNESAGKSDVSEAEKTYKPVKEEYDLSENWENGLSKNMEVGDSKCDIIEKTNVFYTEKDRICAAEQRNNDPNGFQVKQEIVSDKNGQYEEDSQDSKSFVNQFIDPEGKVWNRSDVEFSKSRISEFFKHLGPLSTVKSEVPDFGNQSDCDERTNERTDASEDDIQDSKVFVQQDLDKERKLWKSIDTVSSKKIRITEGSQHTSLLASEPLGIGMQSGCDEIMKEETNVSEDESEDSKSGIHQYLDEKGNLSKNIDAFVLKKEGAARELHENELSEMEDSKTKISCYLDGNSTSRSNFDSHICDVHETISKCSTGEFITGSNFQLHLDAVRPRVKKNKCQLSVTNSCNPKCHIDSVHLEVKKHKCHLCVYSSMYKGNLKCHIDSVHLNVKKHNCHLCDYRTAKSNELNRHINSVHLKVRKHKCHLCEYSTAKSCDLNRHIDGVHHKVKRQKIHQCHLCDFSFTRSSNLNSHIDSVHFKVKKHKCHLCDYSTAYYGNLKCHIDRSHLKVK